MSNSQVSTFLYKQRIDSRMKLTIARVVTGIGRSAIKD